MRAHVPGHHLSFEQGVQERTRIEECGRRQSTFRQPLSDFTLPPLELDTVIRRLDVISIDGYRL